MIIKAYSVRATLILLSVAALLQVIDTSAGWLPIREKLSLAASSQFTTKLQNSFWKNAGSHYKSVVTTGGQENWEAFGVYASENQMATNIAHIARVVKVVKTGELTKAVKLNGIGATAGAKAAIEAAGGSVA